MAYPVGESFFWLYLILKTTLCMLGLPTMLPLARSRLWALGPSQLPVPFCWCLRLCQADLSGIVGTKIGFS